MTSQNKISRRKFITKSAQVTAGLAVLPYINCKGINVTRSLKRTLGRIGFETTTLGLGGQASIQWTPSDVDPVQIILKAFKLGINYFDTSNLYGPSQLNYGKAFKELKLIPNLTGYNEALRKSIFLTSKTHLRYAKGIETAEGINNWTNGKEGTETIDDVKRTLSQIFGDGEGYYPPGAYLNMVLIHSVSNINDVDAVYEGYENPDPKTERIGALAALLDYRDGTNKTGLNPKEEKLINHIGFSGHYSPPVMIEMMQRDTKNILDGLLVAINSNDKLNFNMQNNVLPVAKAKNMGIIGMKVFADGAMYAKNAEWSNNPDHVYRNVGSPDLPSKPLIEYTLTTPGINTVIIGIGQIDNNNSSNCQLTQNLSGAQILPDGLSENDRIEIEESTKNIKDGNTNYFQAPKQDLTAVNKPEIFQKIENNIRKIELNWYTAYAGSEPIERYEIWRDNQLITNIKHKPQITKDPFSYEEIINDRDSHVYFIKTIDKADNKIDSEMLNIEAIN